MKRIGSLVVASMNFTLELFSFLTLISSTICIAIFLKEYNVSLFFGVVLGFLVGLIIVAVFFGTVFLFLEINNNLILIKETLRKINLSLSPKIDSEYECDKCNNTVQETDKFCAKCGNSLDETID